MVKVYVSSVMDAPIAKVWPFICDLIRDGVFAPGLDKMKTLVA